MTATTRNETNEFAHIAFREVEGNLEAFLLDSGLAIWEIAWLGRSYGGDARKIADNHTVVRPELIEEGLRYAIEHSVEIDAEIIRHTERPLEELLELLPGMRVVTVEMDGVDRRHA